MITTDRQKLVREFESMKQQRYFIDMKEWFGDEHIANLFREEDIRIDPEWLRQDGQQPEIDALMQSLFERM